jgi:hypothetical protein
MSLWFCRPGKNGSEPALFEGLAKLTLERAHYGLPIYRRGRGDKTPSAAALFFSLPLYVSWNF